MAPPRKLKGASASAEAYPTGAVLLGALRNAINIPLAEASNRTVARATAGEIVEEVAVLHLCRALAAALVEKGVIASRIENADQLIGGAIYALVRKWDAATMTLRIGEPRPLDWRVMTVAAAQLFVVELGIRVGAWLALQAQTAVALLPESRPTGSTTMEFAIKSTGLTQGGLANALDVPESTIVRWRKGTRPQDAQIEKFRGLLGSDAVGAVKRSLICAAILEELAETLPEQLLADLWQAFARTTKRSQVYFASKPHDTCRWAILFGADQSAEPLIELLLQEEQEFRWRAPIDSARYWGPRLEFARAIAWRAVATDLPVELREMVVWCALNEATPAIGQFAEVLAKVHPELAEMAAAGKHLFNAAVAQRQRRFADAVEHLKKANALQPTDPGVTRAVIDGLIRAGELDDAILRAATQPDGAAEAQRIWAAKQLWHGRTFDGLSELEALIADGDTHPEMFLYIGVARYQAQDFAGALEALERVVDDKRFEHHGVALDIAAECAFRATRNKRGEELARRANHVGVSRMYLVRQAAQAMKASEPQDSSEPC